MDARRYLDGDQKILILVVDRRVRDTKLAGRLMEWEPMAFARALQRAVSDRVTVRLWEL